MDNQQDTILRAVLRCAIAAENHRTNLILEKLPYAIIPTTTTSPKTASVVSEVKYMIMTGAERGKFQSDRHSMSFKTLNYFFFNNASLPIKQAYKYFNIPGSRASTAYLNRETNKFKLFDEINSLIEREMYSIAHQKCPLDFDAEKINNDINLGIVSRNPQAPKNLDFKPLLNIIHNELEEIDKRGIALDDMPQLESSRNTFLNYLNTFTLAEYYIYRKTINDHYFKNCDRPLYKSPEAQYYLFQEAVDTQIYPQSLEKEKRDRINMPVFRDKSKENIVIEPLDHNKSKEILNDIIKTSPEALDEIPALLNNLLRQANSERKVAISKVNAIPVPNDKIKYKVPRYKIDLKLEENPTASTTLSNAEKIQKYCEIKKKNEEQQKLIDEVKNSTQLSLFK